MGKIPPKLEPPNKSLDKLYDIFSREINGKISFGDGVHTGNIDGSWVSTVTPGAPDTDFTLNHVLNRVPIGYLIVRKSAAVDVYDGSVLATTTQITLRATVVGVTILVFVF